MGKLTISMAIFNSYVSLPEGNWLVVSNIFLIFPYIGNVMIPTDFHIFQRGWNHQPG